MANSDASKPNQDKQRALLAAGARIVAREGPQALSVRRLGSEVGASTMAVYTWYGSKANLMRAIYREAFGRFGESLQDTVDECRRRRRGPLTTVAALGVAYRDYALSEPWLYQVMFGFSTTAFDPEPADIALALGTFQILVEAVRRCVDEGALGGEPDEAAWQIWAAVHGAVSLELAASGGDHLGGAGGLEGYRALSVTVLCGLGADRRRVERAIAALGRS